MDAVDFLKVVVEPTRLGLLGLLALRERTLDELAAESGQRSRDVLATLAPLLQAGVVDRDAATVPRYRLRPEALREIARDLPQAEVAARTVMLGMTSAEQAVLGRFFRGERLTEIPSQRSKRLVVLERLALEFEPGVHYTEAEVNVLVQRFHPDVAALRRYLVDEGLLDREAGRYWRSGGRV